PGRRGEVGGGVRQMADRAAGHVARQHLLEEQRKRRRRIERALPPIVIQLLAHLANDVGPNRVGHASLDLRQCGGTIDHPWPPVEWVFSANPIVAGGHILSQSIKCSDGAKLRAGLMALRSVPVSSSSREATH